MISVCKNATWPGRSTGSHYQVLYKVAFEQEKKKPADHTDHPDHHHHT